ncbi:hypothetical protein RB620_01305 [Paenibacillus sp. LHD-117]|uniref:hypothetical protein n=1 Tax=Paenibacillus sp. LHD-117 TaxID=3071412 RepID=UPI0027DEC7C0|nr:hypothetical protein [Paenibacillus sp. LHD-117]MDQ6418063.1 hypothetical protein [Paenibacillus sp. LHD-117]
MLADHAYVLTPTDVRNIRNYVQTKYAAMSNRKRAEIVADAVSRIIHKQLPDFEPQTKHFLTSNLIRTTVLEERRPVSADDIYRLCLELDQENEAIAVPFRRWVRAQETRLDTGAAGIVGTTKNAESSSSVPPLLPGLPYSHIRRMRKRSFIYGLLCLLIVASASVYALSTSTAVLQGSRAPMGMPVQQKELPAAPPTSLNELPAELRYAEVDRALMEAYLNDRGSILADAPYLNAIIQTARDFDIHPAVLFAITGQEQSFVPRSHKKAKEIANNPFNVFYSWEKFNTTIEQSSAIAARTINRLSKDKPTDMDPFVWINREYAEDPNWSIGVRSIFSDIMATLDASPPLGIK